MAAFARRFRMGDMTPDAYNSATITFERHFHSRHTRFSRYLSFILQWI